MMPIGRVPFGGKGRRSGEQGAIPMVATARERFLDIARFKRPGDLYMMSMFNALQWSNTLKRWIEQGAPDGILLDPEGPYLYGETVRQNEIFGFDRCEMMWQVRTGLAATYQGNPRVDVPPKSSLVPIWPLNDLSIVKSEGSLHTAWAASGHLIRIDLQGFKEGQLYDTLENPVKDRTSWEEYKKRLDPHSPERWPEDWPGFVEEMRTREHAVGLWVGSFYGWLREWMGFEEISLLFYDDPKLVEDMMDHVLYFVTESVTRVLTEIEVDFAMFWEDMCYKSGPMISPATFRKLMMPRYKKVVDLLRSKGVDMIIVDTDGNVEKMIPLWLECGVNATWPLEVAAGNDAVAIRKEYGRDFIVMGNLDKREIAKDKQAIEAEVMKKVPVLLEDSGYFPSLDHMASPDIPWENYISLLDLLREIAGLPKTPVSSR
jgi:uroporphyrinogen decarboxylase